MGLRTKQVLHVGCGAYVADKLHPAFRDDEWQEVRLDSDPEAKPDIVANLTALDGVEDGRADAVYSAHNLEHLYPHEVPLALREFRRVLQPDGVALITLPDLQSVAQLVANGQLDEPAYQSSVGPIAPLDILYGFRPALAQGYLGMAPHTGFTSQSLTAALSEAGFAAITVQRNPPAFSLWAIAFPVEPSEDTLREAQSRMFPLGAP